MFYPGELWLDTEGNPIQAHGGGILRVGGRYYWYGENKDGDTQPGIRRVDAIGVSCYSSTDLVNWHNEGIVLPAVRENGLHDLHPTKILERPKVVYNVRTDKYVMWMHVDCHGMHDNRYSYAAAGVAVADSPTGPFGYIGSIRLHGLDSRDLTLFQDNDGSAYLVYASERNTTLHIAQLQEDYLGPTPEYERALVGSTREAPALFKHQGTYFMVTSGCTGWQPNPCSYAVAPSIFGPWEEKGNPCVGVDAEITFQSQGTFVLPVGEHAGAYIFMADRWNPGDLRASQYVWLPLFVRGQEVEIAWQDQWDLTAFDHCSL